MMHPTVEEIIEFVSFNELSDETIDLSAKVNEHIRNCPNCKAKVSSFQMVYDELCRIGNVNDAKKSIYRMVEDGELTSMIDSELKKIQLSNDNQIKDIIR